MKLMRFAWLALVAGTACTGVEGKLKCEQDTDCLQLGTCSGKPCDGVVYGCDTSGTQLCVRKCTNNQDCLASQRCDNPGTGTNDGFCRDTTSGGDGGDSGGDGGDAAGDTD